MKKRLLILISFILLALVVFVGCDNGDTTSSTKGQPTSTTNSTPAPSTSSSAKECTHIPVTEDGFLAPTCTEEGYTAATVCSECGEVLEEREIIPPTGHTFKYGYCEICSEEDPLLDLKVLIFNEINSQDDFLTEALKAIGVNHTVAYVTAGSSSKISGYDVYICNGVLPSVMPTDGAIWLLDTPTLPTEYGSISNTYTENSDGFKIELVRDNDIANALNSNITFDKPETACLGGYRAFTALAEGLFPIMRANNENIAVAGTINELPTVIFNFSFYYAELPAYPTDFVRMIENMLRFSYNGIDDIEKPSCSHSRENIEPTPATCVRAGLSKGVRCSKCGKIIIPQEVVPPTGKHTLSESGQCLHCDYKEEIVLPSSYTFIVDVSHSLKSLLGDKTMFSHLCENICSAIMQEESNGGMKDIDYISVVCFDQDSRTVLGATVLGDKSNRESICNTVIYELTHYFYAFYFDSDSNETDIPVLSTDGDKWTSQGYSMPLNCSIDRIDPITGQYILSYGTTYKFAIQEASAIISQQSQITDLAKKTVIFISDGAPNDLGSGYEAVVERMAKEGIIMHTASLFDADSSCISELSALAEKGNGTYSHADTPTKLLEIILSLFGNQE